MIAVQAEHDVLLRELAMAYLEQGYSVVVTNRYKAAIHKWTSYQQCRNSQQELSSQLNRSEAYGIAIVCGTISGNIEVIDIDEKNALQGAMFEEFLQLLQVKNPEILPKLAIAKTKNKGYHLIYVCASVGRSRPLARRCLTVAEQQQSPKEKVKVLIETRGTDGYFVVFPTPGYRFTQKDLFHLTELSQAERDCLFEIARSFNTYREPVFPLRKICVRAAGGVYGPFKAYNESGDVIALLQRHGWIIVGNTPETTTFRRPGNTDHHSSGNFNHRLGWFSVFTTSSDFEVQKAYQPYAVFAVLECDGNFTKAKSRLIELGYH